MKKRFVCFVMALIMCLGFAVPVLADEWQHYPEDGPYFLIGWEGQDTESSPTIQVSLVSDEPIYHLPMEDHLLQLALGTQIIIELFNTSDTATRQLENATVKLGIFNGNATRNETIEGYWLFYHYDLEFDYVTLLEYNRNEGGFIVGSNRIVHVLDTSNVFYVRVSMYAPRQQQGGSVGTNVMADDASPIMLAVGGGGDAPRGGWMQINEHSTTTTTPNLNTASTWAHDGIIGAFELGLIPQALQNNFTANTSRAEFSALAVALYETVTGRVIAGRMQFNDTTDINVQKMGYLGVVTGVGGGNFAPNDTITREQAAVMIARLANAMRRPLPLASATFADNADISSWAIEGVGQVQGVGIMGGVGNNVFAPRGMYTREQSIITMLRLFDLLG